MQLRKHAGEEQHTLYNSMYKLAQEQQTLCTAESTNSRFLDWTRWNSWLLLFLKIKKETGLFGKTNFLSAPYIIWKHPAEMALTRNKNWQ